jgi:hypothetical protein
MAMDNPYLELTEELNRGRLRPFSARVRRSWSTGWRIMSKDGDWILREDAEAADHVLEILSLHGARYRFGAPLEVLPFEPAPGTEP